ncbi:MAG: hypothetical protein C0596_17680 [Marinilabiliales bacterium]|nr:MAG: hypothetical protein C0596_17680 [Marinilabiliales bacterium]
MKMSRNVKIDELKHFNRDRLLEIIDGDEEFIIVLVKTFFDHFDKYLNNIKEALINQDENSLKLNSHTIKGSSRSVSFEKMAFYASKIEEAEIKQKEKIEELIKNIEEEYLNLKKIFDF